MKIKLKIDKLSLSTPKRISDFIYPYTDLPGYKPYKQIKSKDERSNIGLETKDTIIRKYENIIKYISIKNGSSLIVCHKRKKKYKNISPIYILLYTDYYTKITYSDVLEIEQFFKQFNVSPLRVSIVHLALDLITKHRIRLYNKIITTLKPGTKRKPSRVYDNGGTYFGTLNSGNQLLVYDKTMQLLEEKGIEIDGDVCRIELRMRMHKMNNFIRTIDELAHYDWSHVYPIYYSFHFRTKELKQELKAVGESWKKPLWELRDIMKEEHEVWPSNFYRDYLIEEERVFHQRVQLLAVMVKAVAENRLTENFRKKALQENLDRICDTLIFKFYIKDLDFLKVA